MKFLLPCSAPQPAHSGKTRSISHTLRLRKRRPGSPIEGAVDPHFGGDSGGDALAHDDLPALGYPAAGLAPEVRVVAVASCGSTCGHLSTGALR